MHRSSTNQEQIRLFEVIVIYQSGKGYKVISKASDYSEPRLESLSTDGGNWERL